jgi:hypothetical protein
MKGINKSEPNWSRTKLKSTLSKAKNAMNVIARAIDKKRKK